MAEETLKTANSKGQGHFGTGFSTGSKRGLDFEMEGVGSRLGEGDVGMLMTPCGKGQVRLSGTG